MKFVKTLFAATAAAAAVCTLFTGCGDSGSDAKSYVPSDAKMVGYVNVQGIFDNAAVQKIAADNGVNLKDALKSFAADNGMAVSDSMPQEVYFFPVGPVSDMSDPAGAAIISGTKECVDSMMSDLANGAAKASIAGKDAFKLEDGTVVVRLTDTVVLGGKGLSDADIARIAEGGASNSLADGLSDNLMAVKVAKGFVPDQPDCDGELKVYGGSKLTAELIAGFASADEAEMMETQVTSAIGFASMMLAGDKDAMEAAQKITCKRDGAKINVKVPDMAPIINAAIASYSASAMEVDFGAVEVIE